MGVTTMLTMMVVMVVVVMTEATFMVPGSGEPGLPQEPSSGVRKGPPANMKTWLEFKKTLVQFKKTHNIIDDDEEEDDVSNDVTEDQDDAETSIEEDDGAESSVSSEEESGIPQSNSLIRKRRNANRFRYRNNYNDIGDEDDDDSNEFDDDDDDDDTDDSDEYDPNNEYEPSDEDDDSDEDENDDDDRRRYRGLFRRHRMDLYPRHRPHSFIMPDFRSLGVDQNPRRYRNRYQYRFPPNQNEDPFSGHEHMDMDINGYDALSHPEGWQRGGFRFRERGGGLRGRMSGYGRLLAGLGARQPGYRGRRPGFGYRHSGNRDRLGDMDGPDDGMAMEFRGIRPRGAIDDEGSDPAYWNEQSGIGFRHQIHSAMNPHRRRMRIGPNPWGRENGGLGRVF